MDNGTKKEIKDRIRSKIRELETLASERTDLNINDSPGSSGEPSNEPFFTPPKWQEHLVNINKLWNVYLDEGNVRPGILHEINEGWELPEPFSSGERHDLRSILENGQGNDTGNKVTLFKDTGSRNTIQQVLKDMFQEMLVMAKFQREFNAKIVRSINTFYGLFENIIDVQKTFNAETVRFINEYIGIDDPESQNVFLQERKRLNDRLEAFIKVLERRIRSSELKIHREIKILTDLATSSLDVTNQLKETIIPETKKKLDDTEYTFFEELWRGDPREVKEKQKRYITYFFSKTNVLDFGCGRGEFLELLKKEGIESIGVEENEEMVNICREKNLKVVCQDGIKYLESIPDKSLGGIFLSHVVEHFTHDRIGKLVSLSYRKLEPGGVLAVETVNPSNFYAYFHNFVKDFTHETPIHPDTMKFVLEMNGFKIKEVLNLSEVKEEDKLQLLKVNASGLDKENLAIYNKNLEKLNMLLFGNQDYAVVACK